MSKVSFDYDGTLSKTSVQAYAKSLVEAGHEVWITTSRYDSIDKYSKEEVKDWQIEHLPTAWTKLFDVADEIGISREHIIFTNKEPKLPYVKEQNFLWHLDDDLEERDSITMNSKTMGIWAINTHWKDKCNNLLNEL